MIVSFYSYKGGVGRSQLCANIAAYLFYQKGKRVLLWDWDFEAPGLHYFFGLKNENIAKKGTLELLEDYTATLRKGTEVRKEDLKFIDPSEHITPLAGDGETSAKSGCIDLLAAGNYNNGFNQRTNNFDWFEFYSMLDGANYIELLKENLKTLQYDYVLIDSRTGISDYSGICNIQLPEVNVIVVAPTMQNFEGSKGIMEQIINADYLKLKRRKPLVLPILSRLDHSNPKAKEWMDRFAVYFSSVIRNLDEEFDGELLPEIFSDVYCTETFLAYTQALSAGENILFSHQSRSSKIDFSRPFQNIAELIESLNNNGSISFYKKVDEDTWHDYAAKGTYEKNNRKAAIAYTQIGIKQKDPEAQLKYYQQAIETDPAYYLPNYLAGAAQLNNGKVDIAVEFLQKAIALNPQVANAYFNLGLAYYTKNVFAEAVSNYEKAIALKPDYDTAYFNLGIVYDEVKNAGKAIEQYRKAIELKPDEADYQNNLGIAYDANEESDKAIECFLKAVSFRPDYYVAYNNLGATCLNADKLDEAMDYLNKAVALKPDYSDPYYNLGHVYSRKGNVDRAVENYLMAERLKPGTAAPFNAIGRAYENKGDVVKALEYYQKAVDQKADFAEVFFNTGNVYNTMNQPEKAIENYLKAISLQPDFSRALNNLGYQYLKTGDLTKAEPLLVKSIELGEKSHANLNYGHLLLCTGKREEAMERYLLSYQNFSDKKEFWEGMNEDFALLQRHGINTGLFADIKQRIEAANQDIASVAAN